MNKFARRLLLGTIIVGSISGYGAFKYSQQKSLENRNVYIEKQKKLTNVERSMTDIVIDSLKKELNKDMFYPVLKNTATFEHTVPYTEKEYCTNIFNGEKILIQSADMVIAGYGDVYFEFGVPFGEKKIEKVREGEINMYIDKPILNEDSVHRVPNSFSPIEEKRKVDLATRLKVAGENLLGKPTMDSRAMTSWEDSLDLSSVGYVNNRYLKEPKYNEELLSIGLKEVTKLVDSLNVYSDKVKINVKYKENI